MLALALGLACSHKDAPAPNVPADEGTAPVATGFENPGGMWMPGQMIDHAATLQELGLAFEPSALADPTAAPLGAVVSLGGCSASFVSPEGLVVTNHHCAIGALQYNSSPKENLLHDGFLAAARADERWTGPTSRIYVTSRFEDVTSKVLEGTAAIEDPKARYEALSKRVKELESTCEAAREHTRCSVTGYFEGAQYFQIEQLEIKDVRLVYAPHEGVGVFGGEVDNWRWPRHTGDFTFLRAYVGPDGKPADHAAENVPYQPPHHLTVAQQGPRPGDLVMVAGYPGRTYRLKTADEVRNAVQWSYPRNIEQTDAEIALLESIAKQDPNLGIKAASQLRGLHNRRTNNQGMLDGLTKGGLLEEKEALENQLRAWIAAEPERQTTYGSVLDEMSKSAVDMRKHRARDEAVIDIISSAKLLGVAGAAVEVASQRDKPEAERTPDFEQKVVPKFEQRMTAMSKSYDPQLDRAMLSLALRRASALPEGDRPDAVLAAFLGAAAKEPGLGEAKIQAAVDALYAKTKLGGENSRLKLLRTADSKTLARSRDPLVQIALEVKALTEEIKDRHQRYEGQMAALRPLYVAALREFSSGPLAPDANGTLRVTFGTIRGYRPSPEAELHAPFTTLTQMVAKHTGEAPFAAPASVLTAAKSAKNSAYVDADLGDVPVDFLADLDITGGNSGSATLNGKGELIGLAFDGNYESIASDWVFMPEVTRSIHVDIRYVLWIMDHVDRADHLLKEMGIRRASP
jgi:V8-like Glu-specific endopeptidase